MIAYDGSPLSEAMIAAEVWRKHYAMVSFARAEQIDIAAEHASTFALDNGAFSLWTGHPTIGGSKRGEVILASISQSFRTLLAAAKQRTTTFAEWPFLDGVPVYHLHQPLYQLLRVGKQLFASRVGVERPLRGSVHAAVAGPHVRNVVRGCSWRTKCCHFSRVPKGKSSFAVYVARLLVIAKRDETAVSQVSINRPLDELELSDQLRHYPTALRHLRGRQSCAPTASFLFG